MMHRIPALSPHHFITLITAALASSVAFAAEQQPFAAPQAADPVAATGAGSLAQVTLSLVLVLAAVFAAAWAVRRLRGFGKFGAGAIEIVAEVALGAKERAVLVQVGKQQLLLGVAQGSVNMLHVLAENVTVDRSPLTRTSSDLSHKGRGEDRTLGLSEGARDPRHDFKAILKRSLGL